jgi:hypothetical protein
MNEIVIEHVKVSELPEAWRKKLAGAEDARVTVRIAQEAAARHEQAAKEEADDPLFGMWRDREDMADVEAYVRKLRAPRY